MALVAALLAGYAIGSIPFAVLLARGRAGFDVRREGTQNPGATNVFKNVGKVAGAVVGLLDYFKALAPALLAWHLLGSSFAVAGAVAVGAVLGHDFSLFLGFRGGKGGASTLGAFTFLDFPALLAAGAVWAVCLAALRGRRFIAGPVALTSYPVLLALHRLPRLAALLPGSAPGASPAPVLVAAGLVALLWARILPGHLRPETR
jgi:acyl phosphate:glycerol-3-phosphate acyltransferase